MQNWDDLRVFLAAAKTGSFSHAAAHLHMDATTIGRRITRLEDSLKSTLLTRSPKGLALTAAGAQLFEASARVEQAIEVADAANRAPGLGGVVRISVAEGFGTTMIAPRLAPFLADHPGLKIELAANAGFLSTSKREVDLAITLSPPSGAKLKTERLTDYTLALYAAPSYLAAHSSIKVIADLKHHKFIGYIDDLIYAPELRYLDELNLGIDTAISSSSIRAQYELVRSGAGIAILPVFLGQSASSDVVNLLPDQFRITRTFWMSTHRDVADTPRVRSVHRFIRQLVREQKDILLT
jgi:DNA-binding transcriptional LysR family regulator